MAPVDQDSLIIDHETGGNTTLTAPSLKPASPRVSSAVSDRNFHFASPFFLIVTRTCLPARRVGIFRGQAITEFALVLPILLFMLFAILEGSLLLFVVGSARFGAGEAAREASEAGNAVDADIRIVQQVRQSAIGSTSLARVTSIEIYKLNEQPDGSLLKDPVKINRYLLDGTPIGLVAWPSSARNVTNGSMDFLGITVNYRYDWKSGVLLSTGPFNSNQSFYIRLEPQSY